MKYVQKLKEMFSEMVIPKNAELIGHYYHPELLLYTNEQIISYDEFVTTHQRYYATAIQYEVAYDEEAWVEQHEGVAARLWITTTRPGESPKKIELVLIAKFKEDKIYRLWELTYPDWSALPAFQPS